MVHRARQGYVEARTATINRLRGLLSELGIVLPLRAATVRREAGACLEELPGWANIVVGDLLGELHRLDERIAQYDAHIQLIAREDERARQLMRLSGVGPTTATAILAMIGNGHEFRCGRQFAAWLGVDAWAVQLRWQDAPGAHHQGGRRLPAHHADPRRRAVLAAAKNKTDGLSRWAMARSKRGEATGRRW